MHYAHPHSVLALLDIAHALPISKGWSAFVLPGMLAGLWGYIIATFVGILVAEIHMRIH